MQTAIVAPRVVQQLQRLDRARQEDELFEREDAFRAVAVDDAIAVEQDQHQWIWCSIDCTVSRVASSAVSAMNTGRAMNTATWRRPKSSGGSTGEAQ